MSAENDTPPAATLAEALARIYADGGRYVQKTGRMDAGPARYTYAREGDFIAAIRPLMEAHGVTVRPVRMDVLTNETFERKSGAVAYRVVVLATYELMHRSGDKATVQSIGEGTDSGDKSFNKAMTAALKYALRQTFCVETGDDPDDTPSHEQERAAAPSDKQRVAAFAQQIAQASDMAALKGIGAAVRAAAEAGHITPAGRAHLGGLLHQRKDQIEGAAA